MNRIEAFKILGISNNSDEKEIKRAYRKGASKYHPDKHQDKEDSEIKGNESKFKELKLAYEVLTGKVKEPQHRPSPGDHFWNRPNGDLFEEFNRKQNEMKMNGKDITMSLSIPVDLAIYGGKTDVKIPVLSVCDKCNGEGTIRSGVYQIVYCDKCHANGVIESSRKITITIPKDVRTGSVLRLKNLGMKKRQPKGENGSLKITIRYTSNEYYSVIGDALIIDAYIGIDIWLLGGNITIATPKGKVDLVIASMHPLSKRLRLTNNGVGLDSVFINLKIDDNFLKDDMSIKMIKRFGKYINDKSLVGDLDIFNKKVLSESSKGSK